MYQKKKQIKTRYIPVSESILKSAEQYCKWTSGPKNIEF